jgi:deoxyribodipyrimidine photo-lyase
MGSWYWLRCSPYFRVFNPEIQLKKFDEKGRYIRKWIPNFEMGYGAPMVEHAFAREIDNRNV